MRHLPVPFAAILIWGFVHSASSGVEGRPQGRRLPSASSWTFDRLDRIGGHQVTVEGGPKVVDTAVGKAVEFDGVDDALFVEVHPLAGAGQFTWEAIIRPDGGAEEQRWFHLQQSGADDRMLLELRVINGKWCLDTYLRTGERGTAQIDREKLHPVLAWYHVAAVYDGTELRSYVNGVLQGATATSFAPQRPGRTSIGTRIDKRSYFKGAIHSARFTHSALTPDQFVTISGAWKTVSFPTEDGGTIYGDLYGTGSRGVVLVHGGRFDKGTWADQAYALMKAGFHVLSIDLRGYGRSRGPGDHDIFSAPLARDVLAAARYLRKMGARSVFAVGGSLGGGAAADAVAEAPGEIERLVLVGASSNRPPELLKGRTLFILARDDTSGSGPRLPGIRAQYEKAPDPKELILLDGDAHAQYLFATHHRERVTKEIVRFLSAP